jgi:predicted MFS family arabinose efflux permease
MTMTTRKTRPIQTDGPASRGITLALGVNQLLSWATTFYLPAVVADPAARDLGVSKAAILGGFSWALLTAGVCAPQVGRWIDRHGGLVPLAASTLVLAAGLTCLAASTGLLTWYIAWTVLGGGMALGLYDAAFATAGRVLGADVGPAITGIALVGGFASTVGWPAGSFLTNLFGWRGVLMSYAGVQVIVNLPLILATIPRSTGTGAIHVAQPLAPVVHSARTVMLTCMAGFFAVRWLLTSGIAAYALSLMNGLGLSPEEAMIAAMLIGPGQVAGRVADWFLAARLGPLVRARLGALLFPAGALLLLVGGPIAAFGFAALYGMSNGILTINRGVLPMLVFGPGGYARLLGWLAVPVLLAQAAAPTLVAPLIGRIPASQVFELAGAIAGATSLLLLPLRAAHRD